MRTYLFIFYFISFMMTSCQSNSQTTYTIETNLGNIQVKLYDKTPLHKENFEKLVEAQLYDGVMFHRIIQGFMIQTGNPATKPGFDGTSKIDLNYTIPAEFVPEYFHKKGALAAARTDNPEKRSSSSQFYIVQGRTVDNDELREIESQYNVKFSDSQREVYKSIGGTPFLDQKYTVFGEVVKGMDVVDAIAAIPTGPGNFPEKEIRVLRIVKN
jgi:peptidyl-prolyl cis-trans isomerase B (cyclophilin B)